MSTFPLKIVTPDGLIYDGSAERLIVRSTTGDLAIMARHINFVTPLGMGRATVIADGTAPGSRLYRRYAQRCGRRCDPGSHHL